MFLVSGLAVDIQVVRMQEYTVESSAKAIVELNEKIRVLHVDDDSGFLKVAKQCLELEGPIQVDTALSVNEASARLEKEKYDVIISDYQMPEKDGLEFLRELRENGNTIPFIMFTGKGREEVAIKALNLGANQYLNKVGELGTVYKELAHSIIESIKVRKAEERLRESEEFSRSLIRSVSPDCVLVIGEKRTIIDCNDAAEAVLGYSRSELIGKKTAILFSGEKTYEEYGKEMFKAIAIQGYHVAVVAGKKKNGEEICYEVSCSSIKGKPGVVAIVRNVTDKARKEEKLRDSEEKFRNLAEQSPNIIFINVKGRIVYVNRKAEEVMGYEKKEFFSTSFNFLDLIAPEFKERVESAFNKNMRGEESGPYEFGIITKEGKRIDVILNSRLIKYDDEQAILGIVTDITDQKRSERIMLENKQRFEGLFKGNPEAAVYLSSDFHILDINPRFEQLFGRTLAEIKGKHLDDVIVQKDKIEEAGNLNQRALEGYVYHDTLRKRKDGTLIPVSVSAAPITVDGRLEGYVGMYKDISELRNTEEELKHMMGKLETINEKLRVVGSLTRHDVQNKLTVVTGNAYLLKKKAASDPEMFERLRDMEEGCKQIVEIFDFARSYETLGEEELRYVDVADAFDKAVLQFGDLKGAKTLNGCKGLTVFADSLLTRMFYNLIDDSLKYGEKLTQIRIRYEKSQEQLKLVYEDDGVGISSTDKPKLFAKGYGRGTGYGLYLIKKMMEVYGWTIQETGEPGKGAQFTITIPRTNQKAKENY